MMFLRKNLQKKFPASFIFEPVFLVSVVLLIFNDFYLKPLAKYPIIAGKLSDFCLMIIVPFFICLVYSSLVYLLKIIINFNNKKEFTVYLDNTIIIFALVIAGGVMILLQVSDNFNYLVIKVMKLIRGQNKIILLTKDPSDIISLINLIPAGYILSKYKK